MKDDGSGCMSDENSNDKPRETYDAGFITDVVERFHRYAVDEADARGLAGMLGPVDRLAESAAGGVRFDDEPADFLRVMHAERGGSGRGGRS
jgi:hypothetical protein